MLHLTLGWSERARAGKNVDLAHQTILASSVHNYSLEQAIFGLT